MEKHSHQHDLNSNDVQASVGHMVKRWGFQGDLWISALPPANSHLVERHVHGHPHIMQTEIFDQDGCCNARIYGFPDEKSIPTIVLGGLMPVARSAYYDNAPIIPLPRREQKAHLIPIGILGVLEFPDILSAISGLKRVEETNSKLFFASRHSSYILVNSSDESILDNPVSVHWHVNVFSKNDGSSCEFFGIAESQNDSPILPSAHIARILFTNSETYLNRHPERQFIRI